jgi:hypothetical protein
MEKILKIEDYSENGMDGFAVTTDKQVIKLLVDGYQSCCEDFGYFMSEENLEDFVGGTLLNVTVTDTALATVDVPNIYEGGIMFVNIETDRGVLQFVAYNEHNGYYGHQAKVISNQVDHSEFL